MASTPDSTESAYVVRDDVSPETIARSLQAILPTKHDAIGRQRFIVLDTFDRRLRRAGARLTQSGGASGGECSVAWQPRGARPSTFQLAQLPGFAWDVPHGPLQQDLEPIIGVRRLLAQADAEAHGSLLEILDDRRKTVARLQIQSARVRRPAPRSTWQPLPTIVTLIGLRGYEDAYRRIVPVVESRPGVSPCPDGLHGAILDRAGAAGLSASSPLTIDLPLAIRADMGARRIHHTLFDVLVANEPGVLADLDTEFLHDFRVALRRMRSLLGQLKHVFVANAVEHFSEELSWMARLTGPPRDLDVLTLAIRAKQIDLPSGDIDELLAFLARTQARERRPLIEALGSRRYRAFQSEWRAFLDRPASSEFGAPNAGVPLVDVVSRRAWRLNRRIAASAATIDRRTSAAHLHDVRIAAKKLRYMVDLAPTFYDAQDLEPVLGALKKLQRVLGEFNDASVQETQLLAYRRVLDGAGVSPGLLRTLGRLAADCRRQQDAMRSEVVEKLARFRARSTQSACRRAFKRDVTDERAS